MNSRKLAWSIVATALALAGCTNGPAGEVFPPRDKQCADGETPPCETTEPVLSEADRTAPEGDELDNETRLFVVDVLSIPPPDGDTAPGFNLDGLDSGTGDVEGATCEEFQPDYRSPTDPDHVGVDNALASLVPTIESAALEGQTLDELLDEQITSGSLLLLLEVSNLNSLEFDADVQVQLFRAVIAGGGTPVIGGGGTLEPGQAFEMLEPLGDSVPGTIFEGRLAASTNALTIPIATDEFTLELVISSPEVRFDISEDGLANGQIGGVLAVADLIAAVSEALPDFADAVGALVGPKADVNPSDEDAFKCEGLSVGISFGATTAVRNN